MTRRRPIADPPARLRQRASSLGSWRVWWEPCRSARALDFSPFELDPERPTWSVREAERLNAQLRRALKDGKSLPSAAAARTVSALIDRYCASPAFRDGLKPASQADRRDALKHVAQAHGGKKVVSITKPEMVSWYETIYPRGATQARRLVRAASRLFSYAEQIGWIAEGANPCQRLSMVTPAPRDRLASWEEVGALLTVCATPGLVLPVPRGPLVSVGTAIALSVFQAQRQADVLPVTAGALEGDVWTLERSKTGQAGEFDLHPFAAPWVQRAEAFAEDCQTDQLIVYEGTRRPFSSADHFRQVYQRARTAAAEICPSVADLQFRDLRRTASHQARLGGADALQRADLLGNASDRVARLSLTYAPAQASAASAAVHAIQPPAALAISPGEA